MVTRVFSIYEVPNAFVAFGASPTISAEFRLSVSDDDGFLDRGEWIDPGNSQDLTIDGQGIDAYRFFYDDTVEINGNSETIKTFQLKIDGTVRSFVMNDEGTDIPGLEVGGSFTLITYSGYTSIDYDMLCFNRGTEIMTARGSRPIERLQVGDLVHTLDHGLQEIRWLGATKLTRLDLQNRPHLRPIHIATNALGTGLPKRDLWVSPQHRILLSGWEVELNFAQQEVMTPAKFLVGRAGICVDQSLAEVEYFHLMFDRHEVVLSEGLPSESFLIGATIRTTMDQEQLREILDIFPELAGGDHMGAAAKNLTTPARAILKTFEVNALERPIGVKADTAPIYYNKVAPPLRSGAWARPPQAEPLQHRQTRLSA